MKRYFKTTAFIETMDERPHFAPGHLVDGHLTAYPLPNGCHTVLDTASSTIYVVLPHTQRAKTPLGWTELSAAEYTKAFVRLRGRSPTSKEI